MSRQKQVKQLVAAATQQGWEVHVDGGGHYRMVPPDGAHVGFSISATPSDTRTIKNEIATLRRMGLQLPGQKRQPSDRLCLASWHAELDNPMGFCSHCRGCWKITEEADLQDFLVDAARQDFAIPDEWSDPLEDEKEEAVDMDEGSIRSRVLKALQELNGEFLSVADLATLTEIPRHQVGTALRTLYAQKQVTRSKRGRYGVPKSPATNPPTPTAQAAPQVAPAAPAGLFIHTRTQPAKAPTPGTTLYEATGLQDREGRPVIKDAKGDLYVAVLLASRYTAPN